MRMHRLMTPIVFSFFLIAPIAGAGSPQDKTEFWFLAPDARPGGFYHSKEWNAKDVIDRAAATPKKPAAHAFAWSKEPTDPFTGRAFGAQEEDKEPPPPELKVPDKREPANSSGPSIIAGPVVGGIIFAIGMIGWIALAISAFWLDRARGAQKSA
jgi:hypothetical protein